MARTNDFYGIGRRQRVDTESKAILPEDQLRHITDPFVRLSLELQRAFGLRREEAIKFRPSYGDRGDHLQLKASWNKGNKGRTLPIRNAQQREVLDRVWQLAGNGALIPAERSYVQQLRLYVRQTMNAGLSKMHGLRHAYAQSRYRELTGWLCPAAGGPKARCLAANERLADQEAREIISRELGHERAEIVSVYCG